MSWSFINDSLATTLCLQWEPEIVAGAALYLATRVSRYTIEDWEGKQPGVRWWESFVEGMSTEVSSFFMPHYSVHLIQLTFVIRGTPFYLLALLEVSVIQSVSVSRLPMLSVAYAERCT